MEAIIDAIRAALATDATPEVRAAGAAACRSVLAFLEPPTPPPPPALDPASLPSVIASLRGASPDQLLDLAIAKLRTLVPTDAQPVVGVRKLDIPLVPVRKP